MVGRPTKPAELKIVQGNPGKRSIRVSEGVAPVSYGYREPVRPLNEVGLRFWDSIYRSGELWIAQTDVELVQLVCELLDRREILREAWLANPTDRPINMSLIELERELVRSLSLLGFTPSDRTRLGLVSAKTKSKLQELLDAKAASK